MTPRLRDTLAAIAKGKDTNAALAQELGVHPNTVGLYAKRLAADGFIASTKQLEVVGDARYTDSGRVKVRRYNITEKGQTALCSS